MGQFQRQRLTIEFEAERVKTDGDYSARFDGVVDRVRVI